MSRPKDQAQLLRELAAEARADGAPTIASLPAVAVTGGKGGVGKTCIAVNLGILLAGLGLKPLLIDCDLGLANADVLLGLHPETTLHDVMLSGTAIGAAILEDRSGLAFLPAASGRDELTRLDAGQRVALVDEIRRASLPYDLVLLDMPAGIHAEVLHLLAASRILLVVITPDPTSLTDAYAQIKIMEKRHPGRDLRVLVNQASSHDEGLSTFNRLRKVVRTYLGRDLSYLGQVPNNRGVRDAVRSRCPFARDRDNLATQALAGAAMRLRGDFARPPSVGG